MYDRHHQTVEYQVGERVISINMLGNVPREKVIQR